MYISFMSSWLASWFSQTSETDAPPLVLSKRAIAKLDKLVKPFKHRPESSEESDYQLMNKRQCLLLVKRISDTHVKSNLAAIQNRSLDEKCRPVLRELHHVLLDADRLIQSCCIKSTASDSEWLRAAIEQGDMKETFSKLLYDVEWHAGALKSIVDSILNISVPSLKQSAPVV